MNAIDRIDAALSKIVLVARTLDTEYGTPDRICLWSDLDVERLETLAVETACILDRLNAAAEMAGEGHGIAPDDAEWLDDAA